MKKSRGSMQIIVAIIVVVAAIFGLTSVFYTNYVQQQAKSSETPIESDGQGIVCVDQEKLCFELARDWSSEKTTKDYPAKSSQLWKDNGNKPIYSFAGLTMRSPNGEVVLHLDTGISQLGGGCPDPSQSFSVTATKKTVIMAQNDTDANKMVDVYAVKALVQKQDNTYVPIVILTDRAALSRVGEYNVCEAGYADVIAQNNPISQQESFRMRIGSTVALLNSLPDPVENGLSRNDALSELNSSSYNQAFDILASAHYK